MKTSTLVILIALIVALGAFYAVPRMGLVSPDGPEFAPAGPLGELNGARDGLEEGNSGPITIEMEDGESMTTANLGTLGSEGDGENDPDGSEALEGKSVRVLYTGQAFSPSTVTVSRGDIVVFDNESGEGMWIASDEHPTHTEYSGTALAQHCQDGPSTTAFDQCETGPHYSFKFSKAGTWTYHNHEDPSHRGTIIVQ